MASSKESDHEAEAIHFRHVLRSFEEYRRWGLAANQRRRRDLNSLSKRHQDLLINYKFQVEEVDDRIRRNGDFIDLIVEGAREFGYDTNTSNKLENEKKPVSRHEVEKVQSTLRQFVRDWSEEGKQERKSCYEPILNCLHEHFNLHSKKNVKVLVPGSGLGRLAWEIAMKGYSCIGNEWSFFMLLASNLILNQTNEVEQFDIFPFIHSFSNQSTRQHLLREIKIPDVLPSTLFQQQPSVEFGMVVGDWIEIYSQPDKKSQYDSIVTCFFIDTAQNVVQYLDIIYDILKPQGIWINLGPTLWHYQDSDHETSIEVTVDEVKSIAQSIGFTISQESRFNVTYASDCQSNLTSQYLVDFWVGTKTQVTP